MSDQWAKEITRYCTILAGEGARTGTIKLRRYYLGRFARDTGEPPWSVVGEDILAWLGAHPDWEPSTRKSARDSVVGFYRWAYTSDRIPRDICKTIKAIRIPRKTQPVADDATIGRAVLAADPRERIMLILARDAGLRVHEIAQLHRDDMRGDDLHVRGKGGQTRSVPMTRHVKAMLTGLGREGYFFPGQINGHLSAGHVGVLLRRSLVHYSAHAVRRAFATKNHQVCKDARIIQDLLGHASLATTQLYIDVDEAIKRLTVLEAAIQIQLDEEDEAA